MGEKAEKQLDKKPDKKTDKKPEKKEKTGFFKGVKAEFKKITWPDRNSVVRQSAAVIGISVVVGVIIAVLDMIIQYGISFIIG
ncbi:MAG: preprotein translocase subunit SecE [Lachnospiraceae bacterium]|nr:preprotein translocase subunit SecE [Lachnospiraceae bacterium]